MTAADRSLTSVERNDPDPGRVQRRVPARRTTLTRRAASRGKRPAIVHPADAAWARRIALVVPSAIAAFAAFCVAYNQFYVAGPPLQDTGQYAFVLWRAGLFPKNPATGFPVDAYFGLHFAPIISLASVVSYVVPLGRVDWFCLLHALAYAPLAAALVALAPRPVRRRDAAVLAAAALVFALDGQALVCMVFPHHEILVSGGLCVLLAGLARGSPRVAWAGLALALATREDGGLHAAAFLAASWLLDRSGRPFPVARELVLRMGLAAVTWSALAFALQHTFFPSAALMQSEYLGVPPLAHLGWHASGARLVTLLRDAEFVVLPLAATAVIALVKRDARYLLGWLATVPWLVVNLLAAQCLKASLLLYTGFPFIASVLWVGAYASHRRVRHGAALAAVPAAFSTLGLLLSSPETVAYAWHHAAGLLPANPRALEDLAAELRRRPGRVYVDPSLASWTVDRLEERDLAADATRMPDAAHEGIAFFRTGALWNGSTIDWLARTPYTHCGRLEGTEVFYCGRDALGPRFAPSSPLLRANVLAASASRLRESVVVQSTPAPVIATFGPFIRMHAGTYVVTWRASLDGARSQPRVDVLQGGRVLAATELLDGETKLDVTLDDSATELRAWTGGSRYVLEDLRITARATDHP